MNTIIVVCYIALANRQKDLLITCIITIIVQCRDRFCKSGLSVHISNLPTLVILSFSQKVLFSEIQLDYYSVFSGQELAGKVHKHV